MIAYFKCLCKSKDKELAKKLRSLGYEIKVTDWDLIAQKEAKQYGLKMPFVVENGEARLWM